MSREAVFALLLLALSPAVAQGPKCAFLNASSEQPAAEAAENTREADTKVCDKSTNFCYALWQEDSAGNQTIISQGCWEYSGKHECERSECVAERRANRAAHANTKFCCCTGDLCNSNMTNALYEPPIFVPDEQPVSEPAAPAEEWTVVIVAVVGSCVVLLLCVFVACYLRRSMRKASTSVLQACDPPVKPCPSFSAEHLKLIEKVGKGKYGVVWRGSLRDTEVAVKVFPVQHRSFFCNERDIYSLPLMEHPALLSYYGCDERADELLLVLSYVPLGCLQDFLRHTAPDSATFCKMSASIAAGLAHLHTDMRKAQNTDGAGEGKPCVSHRDLNSRNILVKADLSCCLCDLGLAMKICGSKYCSNGEEQVTQSINDVGTMRYMSPEVLEGAVNLRDCESSLKQIDVYALGLILWEMAVRCPDMYVTGVEVPPYKMPFEAEIGLHTNTDQMQVLVARNKARPLIPETWRDTASIRLLKETIEDCWDHDAEARLTALCVEERLREVQTAWDRQRGTASGVSPTVNLTATTTNNNNYNNLALRDPEEGPPHIGNKECSISTVSEGTVETLLSPSEPVCKFSVTRAGKNAQLAQQIIPAALQPYQGRNPCLERNLMALEPQLLANGNTLVDLSNTDEVAAAESQSLLAHDSLQQNGPSSTALRPATPIPYVQNAVFETEPNCPKQPNVNACKPHAASRWSWLLGNGMRLRLFSDVTARRKQQPPRPGSALLLQEVVTGDKSSNLTAAGQVRPSSLALSPTAPPDWRPMRPPGDHVKTPKHHAPSGRFSLYDERGVAVPELNQRATSVPGDIMNC